MVRVGGGGFILYRPEISPQCEWAVCVNIGSAPPPHHTDLKRRILLASGQVPHQLLSIGAEGIAEDLYGVSLRGARRGSLILHRPERRHTVRGRPGPTDKTQGGGEAGKGAYTYESG